MTSAQESAPEMRLLSVVIPCFNEEEVIAETHRRLVAILDVVGGSGELIFVDDGSGDRTLERLRTLAAHEPRTVVVALGRNFGHQVAISAGLDHARGQVVALIDADLQDPPELLVAMLDRWRAGVQVVYGQRRARIGETAFKRATAAFFYRLLNHLSEVPIPIDTGDFRLMDAVVVDVLRRMPERDRFMRGLVAWAGFRQEAFLYDREERFAGQSKYPLARMLCFALDGLLSFSAKPLRLATMLGLLVSGIAFAGIVYALIVRLCTDAWVSGWAALFIAVLFMGGVQLLCLGILGEYIGRIHREVKARPLYTVREHLGSRQ